MEHGSPAVAEALRLIRARFCGTDALTAAQKEYRLRHTLRVAAIGREIARAEGLPEDALVIGCLLHDLAYAEPMPGREAWLNHGRKSAALARPFVETLTLSAQDKADLLYGIAIHVDDQADFDGDRTLLALSIGDADNIDRFDAYRVYENLEYVHFSEKTAAQQLAYLAEKRDTLVKNRDLPFATPTAERLWRERIDYQIGFIDRLLAQFALEQVFHGPVSEVSDRE